MVPRPTRPKKKNLPAVANGQELTAIEKLSPMQKRLVVWIASGKPAHKFANEHAAAIMPKYEGGDKGRKARARDRVRKWSRTETFRQALWDWSVSDVDLSTPGILQGVVAKAQAGRIDAARLALEITGRHAPNSEVQPAAIQIVMNHVPRPAAAVPEYDVEGEAEEIVDTEDEAI